MSAATATILDVKMSRKPGEIGMLVFGLALTIGLVYAASQLVGDLASVHSSSIYPFVPLGVVLSVALGFELVNGFRDTAKAVATVIYAHSLEPHIAVVWSGVWNFIGVVAAPMRA